MISLITVIKKIILKSPFRQKIPYLCTQSDKRQNTMSVKKTISVSFLLFVNIIMLTHSAVCHHDDQTIVAVCSANQEHDCAQHSEHSNNCHDTEDSHTCCVIKNCLLSDFFTQTNTVRFSKPIFNTIDIIINDIPAYQTIQITDLAGLPFQQKPYIPLFYTDFVAQSIGLRAPPAC